MNSAEREAIYQARMERPRPTYDELASRFGYSAQHIALTIRAQAYVHQARERYAKAKTLPPECVNLDDLMLSVRLRNRLYLANLQTLPQIATWTRRDFLSLQHMGEKTLAELEVVLSEFGLKLADAE